MNQEFSSEHELQNYLNCHRITATILFNRGFRTKEKVDKFLAPKLSDLPNPYLINNLSCAVDRVVEAYFKKEKIVIYGDYDVDGTCGATLLYEFFLSLGLSVEVFQPDRFQDGYGVHVHCVEEIFKKYNPKLIITVDCGINAIAPIQRAKELGIDTIVLDHHKPQDELPDAFAVVDPQCDETHEFKSLCATGVAFLFVIALRKKLKDLGENININLKSYLDLVAVAIVADMMDVRGVNRILLSYGLHVLEVSPRPAFKALLEEAKVVKPTVTDCGFILGPRINAAGRIENARFAFKLLTTKNLDEARTLAFQLSKINSERRALQEKVFQEAVEQAEKQIKDCDEEGLPNPPALVLANENWHEGVLGIVATHLVDKFKRPVVILSKKHGVEGVLKGSMRSYNKIDLFEVVSYKSVSKYLLNFGGHAFAGGVTLLKDNLENFIFALNCRLKEVTTKKDYEKNFEYDLDISISEIDSKLVSELERLGPYGQGFLEPVFRVTDAFISSNVQVLKEKHFKFSLSKKERSLKFDSFQALWFNGTKNEDINLFVDRENLIYFIKPYWNEWQGVRRIQLQVLHCEKNF
jgi:single-stranded-DNA-specific exonuclease